MNMQTEPELVEPEPMAPEDLPEEQLQALLMDHLACAIVTRAGTIHASARVLVRGSAPPGEERARGVQRLSGLSRHRRPTSVDGRGGDRAAGLRTASLVTDIRGGGRAGNRACRVQAAAR